MNNKYFASLLCVMVLAFAPACKKNQEPYSAKASKGTKAVTKKDVNTMIELNNSVFEVEEDINTKKSINKF